MKNKTKIIFLTSLVAIVLVGWYAINTPTGVYWLGKFQASRLRLGKVAGLTFYKLPVEFHRQEHALSCEIASLQMALAGQGISVSESELIGKMAFDLTPRSGSIWGDPNKGFVGNIDGKMGRDGYGVYEDPILAVAKQYTYAEILEHPSEQSLMEQIKASRPVVVWGFSGRGNAIAWNTQEGKQILAVNGEHARVVMGFVGSDSTPDGFILMDPIYGEMYWPTDKFMENWTALDRMAVVVYPQKFPLTIN